MSTISAGTSSGTALVSTGDTSGNLELQSSGVTKLTVGSGGVTLASALPATSGGTGATTYTTGDVIYASATNTLSKLGIGSSGQVLSVSGGVPAWATPSAGALVFLTSQSLSGASSYTITTGISSTYDDYFFTINTLVPSSNGSFIGARFQKGSVRTTTYINKGIYVPTSVNFISYSDYFLVVANTASGKTNSAYGYLLNANSTTAYTQTLYITSTAPNSSNTDLDFITMAGTQGTAAAVTGLNFYDNSGSSFTATFKLYGIAKS